MRTMNDKNDDKDLKTGKPPSPHVRVVEAPEVGLAEVVAAVGELTKAVDRLTRMTFLVNIPGGHTTPTGAALRLKDFWRVVEGEGGEK